MEPKLLPFPFYAVAVSTIEHAWSQLVPQSPPEAPKASCSLLLAPFSPPKPSFYRLLAPIFDRILQIPERRATAANNQELPKTFRNLDSDIALPPFRVLQNASSCNKRKHQTVKLQKGGGGGARAAWRIRIQCNNMIKR